jgi:glycosidase
MRRRVHRLAALLAATCGAAAASAQPLKLHVPSPDWREQIVYFVMTDRFADGDPRNNDQGAGEYDPKRSDRYNGGDLRGLRDRLAYIQGLGATALWLTPPVRNQWLDRPGGYAGHHGYWAQHFKQVDPHLGTLADYKALASALHNRGMFLVQDIVVNHVGNYFDYVGGWDRNDPTRFYVPARGSKPTPAPTQAPFDLNDPRRAADRRAGIYHWTPAVRDYKDREQELNFQMSSLDDLNTENPRVRRALRDSYGFWIREAGVDAFRVDTAFYVPPEFFADFMFSTDARAPGMAEVARRTGRRDFFVFGEGFGIDRPGESVQSARIESYVRDPQGRPLMGGMLNFPFYGALGDVFARGRPTAELAGRIESMLKLHSAPHRMPSFIDNHDVDRFLAGGSEAALKQALLAMMTLPGIPVIYYGTEQGFTLQRAAMFAQGFGSGGRDRYDTEAPLYRTIAAMAALRKADRVFTHGTPRLLADSSAGPGVLAYRMEHEGRAAIVAFNTADHEVLLDNLETGTAPGTVLEGRHALVGPVADMVAGAGGRISLRLAPREGRVWAVGSRRAAVPEDAAAIVLDPLESLTKEPVTGDFTVSGSARGVARLAVVIDGDLARAVPVAPDAQGRFSARIATGRFTQAGVPHRIVAWAEGQAASEALSFTAALPWVQRADVEDPEGDDRGPAGTYLYPTDPSFAPRQMDLKRVRVFNAGGALRIEATMRSLSTSWSPANGFDHVAFAVFIELPGRTADAGATVMPGQNGTLPEGMRWHLRLRAHGWSNALFDARGAGPGALQEGTPVSPGAGITVDPATKTVSFTIPAAALGDPATLVGAKVYLTTWDYDSGWRALAREAAPYGMGGGDPERDPKVMDASAVIVLR